MPMSSTSNQLVILRSGVVVDLRVVSRLIDLEASGLTFTRRADGGVRVGPPDRVPPPTLAWLREHRDAVQTVVREAEDACRRPL